MWGEVCSTGICGAWAATPGGGKRKQVLGGAEKEGDWEGGQVVGEGKGAIWTSWRLRRQVVMQVKVLPEGLGYRSAVLRAERRGAAKESVLRARRMSACAHIMRISSSALLASERGQRTPTQGRGCIPGSGRSPREGNGNPLQYSCLENPMDRGARRAIVLGSQRVRHHWGTEHKALNRESRSSCNFILKNSYRDTGISPMPWGCEDYMNSHK